MGFVYGGCDIYIVGKSKGGSSEWVPGFRVTSIRVLEEQGALGCLNPACMDSCLKMLLPALIAMRLGCYMSALLK